jgi:hypothetical protein
MGGGVQIKVISSIMIDLAKSQPNIGKFILTNQRDTGRKQKIPFFAQVVLRYCHTATVRASMA